ncbi:uncharacterized protein CCR75_001516 [Bremia lactucae]|uniref:Uncharacterized protein n=1 Tax=Bremia lactucae TaxID=4779 RepID=A0A976FH07_BRELC|nr:hypothetical protein CCR75_001516 [Bremia lactucae]
MAGSTNVQRRSSRWDEQEEELRVSQLAARSGQQGDVCWGNMGGQAITASMQLRSPDYIRT